MPEDEGSGGDLLPNWTPRSAALCLPCIHHDCQLQLLSSITKPPDSSTSPVIHTTPHIFCCTRLRRVTLVVLRTQLQVWSSYIYPTSSVRRSPSLILASPCAAVLWPGASGYYHSESAPSKILSHLAFCHSFCLRHVLPQAFQLDKIYSSFRSTYYHTLPRPLPRMTI